MVATYDAAEELAARLEECRRRQVEIWDLFARDFNQKAELVMFLIDLGFSLTADQVMEMSKVLREFRRRLCRTHSRPSSRAEPARASSGSSRT